MSSLFKIDLKRGMLFLNLTQREHLSQVEAGFELKHSKKPQSLTLFKEQILSRPCKKESILFTKPKAVINQQRGKYGKEEP